MIVFWPKMMHDCFFLRYWLRDFFWPERLCDFFDWSGCLIFFLASQFASFFFWLERFCDFFCLPKRLHDFFWLKRLHDFFLTREVA